MGEMKSENHTTYKIIKKESEKDDGRYLIFYNFEPVPASRKKDVEGGKSISGSKKAPGRKHRV
ncbi:MAG: hypothetical protein M1269_01670 [Chloroflexi bacterium]|nr:hypothetical protein [Chloroflexota bacterium]